MKSVFNKKIFFKKELFDNAIFIVNDRMVYIPAQTFVLDWTLMKATKIINDLISDKSFSNLKEFAQLILKSLQNQNFIGCQEIQLINSVRISNRNKIRVIEVSELLTLLFETATLQIQGAIEIVNIIKKHVALTPGFFEELRKEINNLTFRFDSPFTFICKTSHWILLPDILCESSLQPTLVRREKIFSFLLQTYQWIYNSQATFDFPKYLKLFMDNREHFNHLECIGKIIERLHVQSQFGL